MLHLQFYFFYSRIPISFLQHSRIAKKQFLPDWNIYFAVLLFTLEWNITNCKHFISSSTIEYFVICFFHLRKFMWKCEKYLNFMIAKMWYYASTRKLWIFIFFTFFSAAEAELIVKNSKQYAMSMIHERWWFMCVAKSSS